MARTARKPAKRPLSFFHWSKCGDHWAKLTIEWSDTGATEARKDKANDLADECFSAGALKVRGIVQALMGRSQ